MSWRIPRTHNAYIHTHTTAYTNKAHHGGIETCDSGPHIPSSNTDPCFLSLCVRVMCPASQQGFFRRMTEALFDQALEEKTTVVKVRHVVLIEMRR